MACDLIRPNLVPHHYRILKCTILAIFELCVVRNKLIPDRQIPAINKLAALFRITVNPTSGKFLD